MTFIPTTLALFVASWGHNAGFVVEQHKQQCYLRSTTDKTYIKRKQALLAQRNGRELTTHGRGTSFFTIPRRRYIHMATELAESTLQTESIPFTSSETSDNSAKAQQYITLLDWVSNTDGSFIGPIRIAPSQSGIGYGTFLTKSVQQDELILEIPEEVCISERIFLLDELVGQTLKTNIYEKAGPGGNIVCLAGWLAKEWVLLQLKSEELQNQEDEGYSNNDKKTTIDFESDIETYLRTLPWSSNDQEHILFWSEEEIQRAFEGSVAKEDAKGLKEEVEFAKRILRPLLLPIIAKAANIDTKTATPLLPWLKNDEAEAKQERLKQMFDDAITGAFVIVLSRSFQDGVGGGNGLTNEVKGERLIPLLDMFQHANTPNISHKVNPDTFNVEVRARKELKEGTELYNQYLDSKDMPPYKFYTRFGFVPDRKESGKLMLKERDPVFFSNSGISNSEAEASTKQAEV